MYSSYVHGWLGIGRSRLKKPGFDAAVWERATYRGEEEEEEEEEETTVTEGGERCLDSCGVSQSVSQGNQEKRSRRVPVLRREGPE